MKRGRVFAHIYEINSLEIKAYLLPGTDSLIQSHNMGISKVGRIGSYVLINSGGIILVGVVNSLHVMEPEKLFWLKTKTDLKDKQIIRTITTTLIGQFYYDEKGKTKFERGINSYPSIDEEVMVPTQEELDLILNEEIKSLSKYIEMGVAYPSNDVRIKINPVKLFSRHCGIFGSTGNGKSCTVTVLINEIIQKNINLPVFIYDINGEYSWAFQEYDKVRILKFVGELDDNYPCENKIIKDKLKINYNSFSRRTLRTILKPSEKTQIPALNYSVDALRYLPYSISEIGEKHGIKAAPLLDKKKPLHEYIIGDPSSTMSLEKAFHTVDYLDKITAAKVEIESKEERNISMEYLSKLIIDRWSIIPSRGAFQYNDFRYGNISHLCDRIDELCRDPLFSTFCDVNGVEGIDLNETTVYKIKSDNGKRKICKINIFDLSMIPQEYTQIVVNAMLEQHLIKALKGRFVNEPHLLVLDEAHHYLGKNNTDDKENVYLSNPPGERIAKEGRKYGLHLLISSQRPREMSPTIISQLGTIISHALTHESDRNIVSGFGTYNDRTILNSLSVLPRREAIIIGQAISMPTRIKIDYLQDDRRPKSKDPLEELI